MIRFLLAFLSWFGVFFRSRHDLGLELVALRQQVGVLKRKNPRPQLNAFFFRPQKQRSAEVLRWHHACGDGSLSAAPDFTRRLAKPKAARGPRLSSGREPRASRSEEHTSELQSLRHL